MPDLHSPETLSNYLLSSLCIPFLFITYLWPQGLFIAACGLSCPVAYEILVPRPGIEPTSPALEGGFLTTQLPGNPPSVQFSSVTQLCLTLCDPMNRSTPGLPVHHQFPEFTETRPSSQQCHPAISSSVVPFSSCPQSLPASESFPMSQLFA